MTPASRPASTETFRGLPLAARVFVGGTILFAILAVGLCLAGLDADRPFWLVGLLLLSWATATVKISLPLSKSGSSLSLAYTAAFTAMLVLGVEVAVLIAVTSGWIQCSFRTKAANPLHRTLFSMASLGQSVLGAGLVYEWLRLGHDDALLGLVGPVVVATVAYFFLNTAQVALAVAFSTRQSPWAVWHENFLWSAPSYFIGSAIASAAAGLLQHEQYAWGVLVAAPPLYLVHRGYRIYLDRISDEQRRSHQASDVQHAVIESLVLAIEAKDATERGRLARLQALCEGLARAVGMDEDDIRSLKSAAMLHDIGNLAIPEHILAKPAPLTYEEYEKVKTHARVGAEILRSVPFPRPVAPLILSHHERWDGLGYPTGLVGEEIPLGARVLAVVDNYTALCSERPHRRARSRAQALAIIAQRAGKVLDPTLVATFVEILPALERALDTGGTDGAPSVVASVAGATGESNRPFEQIADAHREERTLQDITEALGSSVGTVEIVERVARRLESVMPVAGVALYLWSDLTRRFECRHVAREVPIAATRAAADTIERLSVIHGASSSLVCPLKRSHETLGALVVFHQGEGSFTEDQRRLLRRIARQIASVVHNALVFERAHTASLTDALTGLANRRAMQEHLARDLSRAERENGVVAVILLDLDGFKQINDRWGHDAGDRALRQLASVLGTVVRPHDLCARLGGDEFVVVLWQCTAEQADAKRKELRDAVSATRVETESGDEVYLGVSSGAAVSGADGTTVEQLLAMADRRMYQDKALRKAVTIG